MNNNRFLERFQFATKRDLVLFFVKIASMTIMLVKGAQYFDFPARIKQQYFYYGIAGPAFFFAIWITSLISAYMCSFIRIFVVRLFMFIVFFVSTLSAITYFKVSGNLLMYDTLYVLLENARFAGSAIHEYLPEMIEPFFVSLLAFSILLRPPQLPPILQFKRINKSGTVALVLFPYVFMSAFCIARGGYGLSQTPPQYCVPSLLAVIESERLYFGENQRMEIPDKALIKSNKQQPNIVLIVDESMRGDYLDLNNSRLKLLPALDSHKDRYINFGLASSGGNMSAESNQILRYGANPENFMETFKGNPYIWNYAHKAGYTTVLLEGQASEGFLNDRLTKKECAGIDKFIYIKGENSFEKDQEIAILIKKFLAEKDNKKPYFIYAIKSGMHFPYDVLVPQGERIYQTSARGFEVISRDDMIKSYCNAIHYVNNRFFEELDTNIDLSTSIIFYTSDHGQNLLDNGRRITHGSKENVICYEGLVPLLVATDIPEYRSSFLSAATLNKNKASHFNIFPTILSIWNYDHAYINKNHGKTLFEKIVMPRQFLTGLISVNRFRFGKFTPISWVSIPDTVVYR
jgi:lipid A ethanolaminephosphotransferase